MEDSIKFLSLDGEGLGDASELQILLSSSKNSAGIVGSGLPVPLKFENRF